MTSAAPSPLSDAPERERTLAAESAHRPESLLGASAAPAAWIAPLLVAVVTVVAFLPTLQNDFVNWDDDSTLIQNPHYRGLSWSHVRWMFTTTHMGHWMPLSWVTFGVDYLVWGMKPTGYHLTSLLLHAATAVVFYFVARRLLRAALTGCGESALRVGAAAAALVFAIHPLRVESVAWVTERRDVLSGFWFLLTILTYLQAAGAGPRRQRWRAASVACYALALGSKAIAMTLPFVLIVLDYYPLRRLGSDWRRWTAPPARLIWAEKIPYLVLAVGAAGMSLYAQRELADALVTRPFLGRIAVMFYGLAFYVWKTAIPVSISPLYEIPFVVDVLALPVVLSALAVIGLTVALVRLRRTWPAGLAVWATYAILLAPVSGISQSGPQLVAARYSYLPCLGLALLAGAGVSVALSAASSGRLRREWARAGAAAGALCLVGLGTLTWKQVEIWHDSARLWAYAAVMDPGSPIAHNNLAVVFVRQGRLAEAHDEIKTAIRLRPENPVALGNLADVLDRLGRPEEAKEARINYGIALVEYGNLKEAIELFKKAVEREPGDARAHNNLGGAFLVQGNLDAAIAEFQRTIEIDPGFQQARRNLEYAQKQLGR